MATSRNLTYLGNPFEQGKGKATVVDTTNAAKGFVLGMDDIKANRKAENEAVRAEKELQAKSVDDYKVDYFINHQKHFQGQIDDIRSKGVDLLMKGYNLKDWKNPEVAEWQRSKIKVDSDAQLSKQIGTLMSETLKLGSDPAKLAKVKTESYTNALSFLDQPLENQIDAITKGKFPKIEVLNEVPYAQINAFVKQINDGIPELSMLSQAELDERQKADQARAYTAVKSLLDPSQFNTLDPAKIEQEQEDVLQSAMAMVNKPYEDLKSKRDLDFKEKKQADDLAYKYAQLRQQKSKDDFERQKYNDQQRAFEDYPTFIQGVIDDNLDNVRTLEDILSREKGEGAGKITEKPTVRVVKKQGDSLFNPMPNNPLFMEEAGEFVEIQYGASAPISIKVKNADGSVNERGVQELMGIGRKSYAETVNKYSISDKNIGTGTGKIVSGGTSSSSKRTSSSESQPQNNQQKVTAVSGGNTR